MGVSFILDQYEMALHIMESNTKSEKEALLIELFRTTGYKWLKERELAMEQGFSDADFSEFIVSDILHQQAPAFRLALDKLQKLSLESLINQAKEYLPAHAMIDTFIVPLIKPKSNSFIYPVGEKVVVFLYLHPNVTASKLQNTLIHELHHIGLNSVYKGLSTMIDDISDHHVRELVQFTQPLGEGYAMLAAAGGPNIHPNDHDQELKALWDQRMISFDEDFYALDQYYCNLLSGKYDQKEALERGMELFGIQGPWYTVGWKIAAVIEQICGKSRLIQCIANPTLLFSTYNQAVYSYNQDLNISLPIWSSELVAAFEGLI